MSQIFIIHDLSQSQRWLHWLLLSRAGDLSKSGIELAPFNPWGVDSVPHHCHLWLPQPKDEAIPAWLESQWKSMEASLESGRDLLLLVHSPWLGAHRFFHETLGERPQTKARTVKVLFIAGNPLVALEQRYREAETPLPPRTGEFFSFSYLHCGRLVENARSFAGGSNVHVLANNSGDPACAPSPAIAGQIRAFLGCPPLAEPESLPLDPLFFSSHDGRVLARLPQVRFNAWPRLDEGSYASLLRRLDRDWEATPASPLKLRQELASSLKKLDQEGGSGLPFPFPATPDWLLSEPARHSGEPLAAERAAAFAKALPEDLTKALRLRYSRDITLLSEDQKIFNAALCEAETKDFSHIGEPGQPVELTVLTMTYNQERYIAECMDSVLMQRTNFPVRHIVLDHCSTDGTAAIIAEYARRHASIQPVLLSRRVCSENVTGLFLRCRSKYAALCDGDDYFTEPSKLQKQLDFLENNPYFALCFHPVLVTFEDGGQPGVIPNSTMLPRGLRREYYLSDLFKGNFIQTNSVLYRWRFQNGLPDWFRGDLCPGDWYWHMLHAETGKIGMLPEIMSVYRRHGSALFKSSFVDPLEHRRAHGMAELETYKAIAEHFGAQCLDPISTLADGVFANFMELSLNNGNNTLLNLACKKYPDFATHFLAAIKAVRGKREKQMTSKVI